ncbi:Short-chain dehydrogenase/reductase family protein [Mycena chlorophos]|uniref:Short-chain dehydrogenase/reductase family protein n=1 Tax=Mycena chlorophos TaxID=658473 RepID=A0A8H6VZH3_MYCCL|nr:Short-chain dehydrogenase/reductase family protein [Mycena chlorophos]
MPPSPKWINTATLRSSSQEFKNSHSKMSSLPTFGFSTTAEEVVDALASDVSGKNVLVTGTSINGIGFETARAIAKHTKLVIITGHNAERLQLSAEAISKELPQANVRTLVLDLSSLAAVRKAAAEVNEYLDVLHVLIHNAADTSGVYNITPDGLESQMAVGHFSPFLFTKLLLPKLLASASASWVPRVVAVSSEAINMGPGIEISLPSLAKPAPDSQQVKSYWLRYHEVKSANVLFAKGLAARSGGKIRAYSLHPGGESLFFIICAGFIIHNARSAIYTNAHLKEANAEMLKSIGALTEDGKPNHEIANWKSIPQGASTTVVAAFDPRLNDKPGAYLDDGVVANEKLKPILADPASVDKLWALTEEVLGEKFDF